MSKATTTISQVMLGAGLLAFVYVLVTPRFLPEVVLWPNGVPSATIGAVRWLVGIVIGAFLMLAWQVLRRLVRRSRTAH